MHAQWRRQVAFLDVSGSSVTVFANKLVSGVMFANKDVRFGGGKAIRGPSVSVLFISRVC